MPPRTLEQAARCLRVLAHADRLRIVEQIELRRKVRVSDLAEAVGLHQAAVSQHLSLMRSHGLVSPVRDGREVFYAITNPHVKNVLNCIRKHGSGA